MNVLIVARTKMYGARRCIGGLAEDGRSVRLLTANGQHWDTSSPFQVGQIWDMDFRPADAIVQPHCEDVLVSSQNLVGAQPALAAHLRARVSRWEGGIGQVFGGVLGFTSSDNAYVCERLGVPAQSTGFWIPDRDLTLRSDGSHYDYPEGWLRRGLKYVGEVAAPASLPAGTLVRVSLARWWAPDDVEIEDRCYAQLSGWYV